MRLSPAALRRGRVATLVVFVAVMAVVFGVLWINMGGEMAGVTGGYRVTAVLTDAQNLVYDSDVRIAGVTVGKVRRLEGGPGRVEATIEIRGDAPPLHEGARVRLRPKTLIEETYLEVADGDGAPIPDGGRLPPEAEQPSVRLDDVLESLDPATRQALASAVRRLGAATEGEHEALSATMAALGRLGREGHDALDAIAAQSEVLSALIAETASLLATLDEGEGQIARLSTAAERVTRASAGKAARLEETVRGLPPLLDAARVASPPLRELSGALTPLAEPLRQAAPDLRAALDELPGTTTELRGLLPPLDTALQRAPATLRRTPVFAGDVSALVPVLRVALADINPMLAYLSPYGRDLAAFAANAGHIARTVDPGAPYLRTFGINNEKSPTGEVTRSPVNPPNPYPRPGQNSSPGPFTGTAPRVEEEPN